MDLGVADGILGVAERNTRGILHSYTVGVAEGVTRQIFGRKQLIPVPPKGQPTLFGRRCFRDARFHCKGVARGVAERLT